MLAIQTNAFHWLSAARGWAFVAIVAAILALVVNVLFAIGIYRDGEERSRRGQALFLVGPLPWSLGAFFFGPAGIALYWLVHHSTLARGGGESHA